MKTLAEYFGFKPTKFLPNGCGTGGWLGKVVPDEAGGVNFDDCCDLHDLAYHIGPGGFLGLFYAKPVVDYKLVRCMDKRLLLKIARLHSEGRELKATWVAAIMVVLPLAYFLGLTLLGWTPLTWPWKERPMPSHEQLAALAHNKTD